MAEYDDAPASSIPGMPPQQVTHFGSPGCVGHWKTGSEAFSGGWLMIGRLGWATDDYRLLLRSGFAHDFAALRISEINVQDIDFRWVHPSFTLTAPAADGVVFFDEPGQGRAVLTVNKLNDAAADEPIHVSAWFTPGSGMRFQKVEVRMGRIPIGPLGLDALAGGPISRGTLGS